MGCLLFFVFWVRIGNLVLAVHQGGCVMGWWLFLSGVCYMMVHGVDV